MGHPKIANCNKTSGTEIVFNWDVDWFSLSLNSKVFVTMLKHFKDGLPRDLTLASPRILCIHWVTYQVLFNIFLFFIFLCFPFNTFPRSDRNAPCNFCFRIGISQDTLCLFYCWKRSTKTKLVYKLQSFFLTSTILNHGDLSYKELYWLWA